MRLHEKILRLNEGRSIRSLAIAAGVPVSSVQGIVNNETADPGVFKVASIARTLGVPLAWLVDDDADFPAPPADPIQEVWNLLYLCGVSRDFSDLAGKRGGEIAALAAGAVLLARAARGKLNLDVEVHALDFDPDHPIVDASEEAQEALEDLVVDTLFEAVTAQKTGRISAPRIDRPARPVTPPPAKPQKPPRPPAE